MFFGHLGAEAPRCCSLRVKILSILAGFVLLAGAATVALWPRDPNWNLTDLDVVDESALMFFVNSFGNGFKNDTVLPDVVFRAGARLENPNLIGGTAASGEFKVLYKDKLMGGGQSEPVAVPALGSGDVEARPTSILTIPQLVVCVCVSSATPTGLGPFPKQGPNLHLSCKIILSHLKV